MGKSEITLSAEEIEEQKRHCNGIAAVPELLEALKTLVREVTRVQPYGREFVSKREAIQKAQAVIAKVEEWREAGKEANEEQERLYKKFVLKVYPDGDKWCALYGDNLQEGMCGFGNTPAQAVRAFEKAYFISALRGNMKEG